MRIAGKGFLLMGLFSLEAGAQEDAAARFFSLADADGDGLLSAEEYDKVAVGYGYGAVAGGDGELSEIDYARALRENVLSAPSGLDFLDEDGNGYLSEAEYSAGRLDPPFAEVDVTGDGRVEPAELGRILALQDARADADGGAGTADAAGAGGAEAAAAEEPEVFQVSPLPVPPDVENTSDLQAVEERALVVPSQLIGRALLGPRGDRVGEVENVVMAKQDERYFVVSAAGVYGIEGPAAIAVEDLREEDGGLRLREGAEARPYEAANFLVAEGLR